MGIKEKLMELLDGMFNGKCCVDKIEAADFLIANGITVQECGHWISYESDRSYGCMDDREWYKCSKCGKDAHGRVDDDEWYSAPILSAYCPHCGVKMIPSH